VLLVLLAGCHHADIHQTIAGTLRAPDTGPVLLAAYQPWFGRPGHINVGYSSQDPNVLVRQINAAKDLNIAAFVVNWYGSRHQFEDRSYALLQQASAQNGFKIAIMYDEDVDDGASTTDRVIEDLQYAYDHYIGPKAGSVRSAYLRYDGRPLIFIFPKGGNTNWDQVKQNLSSLDDPPLLIMKDFGHKYPNAFDGYYAWVQPGAGGWARDGSNWGRDYLDHFYSVMTSKYPDKLAIGAAWPGFDDSRASWSRNRKMSSRCGRTFEDSLRLFRRYYNDQHPLPYLMIETWNDYEEGTAIERGIGNCNGVRGSNTSD
jgi:hypothetical protein